MPRASFRVGGWNNQRNKSLSRVGITAGSVLWIPFQTPYCTWSRPGADILLHFRRAIVISMVSTNSISCSSTYSGRLVSIGFGFGGKKCCIILSLR